MEYHFIQKELSKAGYIQTGSRMDDPRQQNLQSYTSCELLVILQPFTGPFRNNGATSRNVLAYLSENRVPT